MPIAYYNYLTDRVLFLTEISVFLSILLISYRDFGIFIDLLVYLTKHLAKIDQSLQTGAAPTYNTVWRLNTGLCWHTAWEGIVSRYLYREMPTMNLEKIYTSPYRSFNFQQLFFYDILCATHILQVIGRQNIRLYDSIR